MSENSRGFGLVELLVAMVIAGVIGVALSRLVISQARFVGHQDALMRARGGARASMNAVMDELRMIGKGGVVAATRDSVTVRVPYAFGLECYRILGYTVVSLFPTDSVTFFDADHSGYARRNATTGEYEIITSSTRLTGLSSTVCNAVGISTLSAAGWSPRYVAMPQPLTVADTANAVYLFQTIRYAFAPSVQVPGRVALWRTQLASGNREELVVPFDTASRFSFLTGSRFTVQSAVPAVLDSIRGFQIRLKAASETTPQGRTAPATFDSRVKLYFRNYGP